MLKTLYSYYLTGEKNSETRAATAAWGHRIAEAKTLRKPQTINEAINYTLIYGVENIPTPTISEYRKYYK